MTILTMDPAALPPAAKALYDLIAAKRRAKGEGFGGPYLALLNHPELARRMEELGFFLKFEGVLPRTAYQFIVLSVARSTGAAFEWQDHVQHARAAGLPDNVIDAVELGHADALPDPYQLWSASLAKTLTWQEVPNDLQGAAAQKFGPEGLIEIVVLSGFYQMFAAINQGFGIGLPPKA
jgi:4-carboxymuconolactone decarboxylase